ncbi:hypothetical protein ColKHC_12767 [Colletotrichum higginsianum]|uniref:Uncharacterized protein n=1 Tax=Colletotrichum higginsianum TaxID=80884 RepID=A0A4V4NA27_9PEZI|nr:hypothetical protein CH35J_011754 [Colletotrichum higginsianum]GJD03942.1 hypothetical protein ColKHC_12767 [Colletotrichum higginsianum]
MSRKPRLLSETELRRFEDRADENAKLADCWASDQVVVIACEPTSAYKTARVSVLPALQLDILSPAANPVLPSLTSAARPSRHFCRRTIRLLERPNGMRDDIYRPQPFVSDTGVYHRYEMYIEDAKAKAQAVFDELRAGYASVCVASCYIDKTAAGFETFGVRVPPTTVFVDLIKVLEHQTKGSGIPEELRSDEAENVTERKGRYGGHPGGFVDRYGMYTVRLLELLGPAAEDHRLDFRRVEREDTALKRISARFRNG